MLLCKFSNGTTTMTSMTKPIKKPYVSAKRSEPRVIEPPPPIFEKDYDETKWLAKYAKPESGQLTYRRSGPGFLETYVASKERNRSLILSVFSEHYDRLRNIIELEYQIACNYFWIVNGCCYAEVNPAYPLLMRTFAGSLVAINSAVELTVDGAYSNALPLMRQVYEGTMIAKLCSLAPSLDVFDRWLDGEYVVFTTDVLRRISKPDVAEFKRFWQCLSGVTHASYYSGQADYENESVVNAAPTNFIFAQMLLEANYHLLCSHLITQSMRYYQKAFTPDPQLEINRKKLKELLCKKNIAFMAESGRRFIRDFRSTWTLTCSS
jgi:hypothetical protein